MSGKIWRVSLCALSLAIAWSASGSVFAADGSPQEKLFSFGIIADVQYGDKDTRGARHYREGLDKLKECVGELNKQELAFTIQLGDIIDGNKEKTHSDLESVLEEYDKLTMPKYHVVGNHCLTAGKNTLHQKLDLDKFYYDFTIPVAKGWRFVVLDGNDAGYGVLGKEQLAWLESRLAHASDNREKVIVFNHFGLLKSAARHRMKTPEPVLKLIDKSGCVVAYFAGHDHRGGYAFQDGIHHVTVKGIVEAPIDNAYAVIEVYSTKLREVGYGKEPSRELEFPVPQSTEKR